MRLSEFWELAEEVFGAGYAGSLAADLVVDDLGGRTAERALADGVPPRDVWVALCEAMDVPPARRWGSDQRGRAAGGAHGRSSARG